MALSEYEQRKLDEMEAALRRDDPRFAVSVSIDRVRLRRRVVAALAFVLGMVVLVGGLVATAVSVLAGVLISTAGLMIMSAHDLPAVAWSAVTDAARTALGLPPVAVVAGAPADLMAVRATTVREAIANGPAGRLVWKRGVRIDETEH